MTTTCRRIQDTLAVEGVDGLATDETAGRHLADCEQCASVRDRLSALDEALGLLPPLDAPDDAVAQLLAGRGADGPSPPVLRAGGAWRDALPHLRWAVPVTGLTTVAVLVAVAWPPSPPAPEAGVQMARLEPAQPGLAVVAPPEPVAQNRVGLDEDVAPARSDGQSGSGRRGDRRAQDPSPRDEPPENEMEPRRVASSTRSEEADDLRSNTELAARARGEAGGAYRETNVPAEPADLVRDAVGVGGTAGPVPQATPPVRVGGDTGIVPPERIVYVAPERWGQNEHTEGVVSLELHIDPSGVVTDARVMRSVPGLDQAAVAAARAWRYRPTVVGGVAVPVVMTVLVPFAVVETPDQDATTGRPFDTPHRVSRRFLDERSRLRGLTYQPARGYWANTYLPGDPVLRQLEWALAPDPWPRRAGSPPVELHAESHRVSQPFDRPDHAALAVYLATDQPATDGPRRALVQVGLQAASRHSGHRVAINAAIVVDWRSPMSDEVAGQMQALLEAFAAARRPADRLSLITAGPDLVLSPPEFRYGAIRLALRDQVEAGPRPSVERDLESAIYLAIRTVSTETATRPTPGAGGVILVTNQPLGPSVAPLERMVARSAAGGIPVSVIGLGDPPDRTGINRVVLAGQGNRRFLRDGMDARALVERELDASGRVVARALRLRIRLAPGVRLVDVVGSHPLATAETVRVRAMERRLDRELARGLGIESDRGADEDGIQIIIPSFQADDHHVILLDVVTPGPGPLADVTVRYKDLVHLRNGVARAGLSLARGDRATGPLELNVVKNYLAHDLATTLEQSAQLLSEGERGKALRALARTRQLLEGLLADAHGRAPDGELEADVRLVRHYEARIASPRVSPDLDYWARSLRHAGLLKVRPRPLIG